MLLNPFNWASLSAIKFCWVAIGCHFFNINAFTTSYYSINELSILLKIHPSTHQFCIYPSFHHTPLPILYSSIQLANYPSLLQFIRPPYPFYLAIISSFTLCYIHLSIHLSSNPHISPTIYLLSIHLIISLSTHVLFFLYSYSGQCFWEPASTTCVWSAYHSQPDCCWCISLCYLVL